MVAQLLPRLVLSSLAGVLADRWDRRLTMIGVDLFRALLLLALLVPAAGGPVWLVYVVAVVEASCAQLFIASQGALLPGIVSSRERLLAANSLLWTGSSVVRLVGPPLGGLLYAALGLKTSVVADSVSFALAALAIAAVRPMAPVPDVGGGRRSFREDLVDGVRLVLGNRPLQVLCVTLGVVMVAQGMLQTLLVPFVRGVLHLDAARYGILMAAQGGGSLIGAAVLGVVGGRLASGRIAVGGGLAAAGVCLLGFTVGRVLVLEAAFILLLSVPVVIAGVWVRTYYQQHVENAMLGRVVGLTENVSALGVLSGVVAASALGAQVGPAPLLAVAGVVLLAAGATAAAGLGGRDTVARAVGERAEEAIDADRQMTVS